MDQVRCVESECISLLKRVTSILESHGFKVECNGKTRGASGSYWDVPCIGSLSIGPVTIRIGVAAASTVDSDAVEYYLSAKNDLALDKVIVVTRERPPEELVRLASRLGISVVPGTEIREPLGPRERGETFYIHPQVTVEEVLERIRTGRIRGLKPVIPILGRRKNILGARLLLYPLLCYRGTIHAHLGGEGAIATREVDLCFEAGSGSLVTVEEHGLSIVWEWGQLGEIEDTAVDVLAVIGEIGTVSLTQLKEHFSDMDVEIALSVLEEYGLVDRLGGDMYTIAKPPIQGYKSPMTELRGLLAKEPPQARCARRLEPMVDPLKLRRIVESIGTVEEEAVLYYPVYMVVVEDERSDIKQTILVDGVKGTRLDDLEEVVSDSKMVKAIEKVMDEIEMGGECMSEPAQPPHSQPARPG
ncbi:MAG: hypothetical protein GSR84_00625 [Desulfurococcales archaeon]|nr:hypothetical protein [Desulfurococcales archaeon]